MPVCRSNKVMDSWMIRLDQINCGNFVCGLTDLIISIFLSLESLCYRLSQLLSHYARCEYAFTFYSYVCENSDHVKSLEILNELLAAAAEFCESSWREMGHTEEIVSL